MQRVGIATSTWSVNGLAARTFLDRLLGIRRTPAGSALLIRARSVHSFGLRRPLEVVALDAEMRVVSTDTLRPNRMLVIPSARLIVELPSGHPVPAKGDRVEVIRE
jgi:uncharacterized membrane protein (UPF0127 family)